MGEKEWDYEERGWGKGEGAKRKKIHGIILRIIIAYIILVLVSFVRLSVRLFVSFVMAFINHITCNCGIKAFHKHTSCDY